MLRSFSSVAALWMAASLAAPLNAQEAKHLDPNLKLNEIQVLGTHNSYAKPADPRLLAMVDPLITKMMQGFMSKLPVEAQARFKEEHPNLNSLVEGLNYAHPDLKTQLDTGVRSLEIDINPDPKGGLFLDPAGYRILRENGVTDLAPFDRTDLDKPGFKVLHIPDIDFRSHCPTLKLCLSQIKAWSDAHPQHVPLFIMLEAKSQALPILPNPTQLAPWDAKAFDDLDQEILSILGRDKIITPDDVRGKAATLRDAVLAKQWPTLKDARGKVIFLMLTANGKMGTEAYVEGHPSLKGRVAFLTSSPNDDYGAFLLLDNALVRQADIKAAVEAGYMVRTRSDIETYEAKVNDMTRAKAAFDSGAQVVSTDFEPAAANPYGTGYVVTLPGQEVARCNTVAKTSCRPAFKSR